MVMMFRLSAIALLVFFASTFGPSQATQMEERVFELEEELKIVKKRLNGTHVQCEDLTTGWAQYADAPIIYLDRQDVKCAEGKFLARFHLIRQNSDSDSDVRFEYRCCQFILPSAQSVI